MENDKCGNVREVVLAEIEAWKRNPPEDYTWHSRLNNFHSYLPSSDYANENGRQIGYFVQISGLLDIKNDVSHQMSSSKPHHSKLFLSQTPREFFEEIDEVIDSIPEVSLDEINGLQHMHYKIKDICMYQNMPSEEMEREQRKTDRSMEAIRALYEYALPVYVELRIRGYSHFDLTG